MEVVGNPAIGSLWERRNLYHLAIIARPCSKDLACNTNSELIVLLARLCSGVLDVTVALSLNSCILGAL